MLLARTWLPEGMFSGVGVSVPSPSEGGSGAECATADRVGVLSSQELSGLLSEIMTSPSSLGVWTLMTGFSPTDILFGTTNT